MTHFIKSGDRIKLAPAGAIEVFEHLPAGTYTAKQDPTSGEYFLVEANPLGTPAKLYGPTPEGRARRVINTFKQRVSSTGVLLAGERGSGKTLLTKLIAKHLLAEGTPVLLINEPHCGPDFNKLINDLTTPSLIIFDEFEKVYDDDEQDALLTLLDGTVTCRHLFILTTNERSKINSYLLNRPGRIYYMFQYGSLDEDVILEYATQNLVDQSALPGLVDVANLFTKFNFDMLQALVEEMNRYGESAQEAASVLNVSPKHEETMYDITMFVDDAPFEGTYYPTLNERTPLEHAVHIDIRKCKNLTNDLDDDTIVVTNAHLVKISKGGTMTFEKQQEGHKFTVVFSKMSPFAYKGFAF